MTLCVVSRKRNRTPSLALRTTSTSERPHGVNLVNGSPHTHGLPEVVHAHMICLNILSQLGVAAHASNLST